MKLVQKNVSAQGQGRSMVVAGRSLRLVVLHSPYDSINSPTTQGLFAKMIALKISGYQNHDYPYGVMPVDASDYVGTHFLICQEWNGSLTPLFAQRSLSMKRCLAHSLPYPLISLMQNSNAPQHAEVAREIIERCVSDGVRFSYESSMTVHPDVRKDQELQAAVRDLLRVIHIAYHRDAGTEEMLSLAAVRFKVDRTFFEFMGYEPARIGQEVLPNVIVPSYYNAEAKLYHFKGKFSATALDLVERYRSFWENRLVIDGKLESEARSAQKAA